MRSTGRFMFLLSTLALSLPVYAQVWLRGADLPIKEKVLAVDEIGVWIAEADQVSPTRIIGWDRIGQVQGPFHEQALALSMIADATWRARIRLLREDTFSAEPLYEQLFTRYKELAGPTAARVAEGLLVCRLRRGAHQLAIEPFLAFRQATENSPLPAYQPEYPSISPFDPQTMLVPTLGPFFFGDSSRALTQKLVDDQSQIENRGDVLVGSAAIRALYTTAMALENLSDAGADSKLPVLMPAVDRSDAAVSLLADIVYAQMEDPAIRQASRIQLTKRLVPETPEWIEVWCRIALGQSLCLEKEIDQQLSGMLELLQVPASFSVQQPYLAGYALARAIVALDKAGLAEAAGVLNTQLERDYIGHPALQWNSIRMLKPVTETRTRPNPPGTS